MEKELQLNEDSWICKDNKLINATYKLSVGEQKLILAISSMVNPFDEEFKDYIVNIKDFAKLLEIDLNTNKNFYGRVKRASGLLLSKRVTINEPDGDFQTVWFSGIKYYDNEGKVAVSFHPKLKKYYLQLKEYTKYRLKNITELRNEYSLKLYEALKQYEKTGKRTYEIKELKKFLGVEKLYDRYYDLKRRILLVTQKEISEKTDICFEFEEIKSGRRITGVEFRIKSNIKSSTKDEICVTLQDDGQYQKVQNIFLEDITPLEAKQLLDASNGDIGIIKEKYKIAQQTGSIDSLVPWLLAAIKQNYQKPISKKRRNKFSDYDQRQYDIKDLERKLLGQDEG